MPFDASAQARQRNDEFAAKTFARAVGADAARALLAEVHCDSLFFAGDDLNDGSVFESAPPSWVTVNVGSERPSSARFALENQAQIGMAVDCILEALTTQPGVGSQSSANGV